MSSEKGKFKIIKKTSFSELKEGATVELPESDLCIQSDDDMYQFEYVRPDEDTKLEIKPGVYTLTETMGAVIPIKTELRSRLLLETIDNTSKIVNEARLFFSNLAMYDELKRDKKRSILLYSKPGLGKSTAIIKVSMDMVQEDPGTVVLNWPTSEIDAEDISKMLSRRSEFTKECTRMILIIEDIGGGERDHDGYRTSSTSGLLNLLDGVDVTFKLPTFILATTNHPENLLDSLANRPGRFDLMMELKPPSLEEKVLLLEFIAKRPITEEEKIAVGRKQVEDFSIAHLEEVVVRSLLHKKPIPQVIDELVTHVEKFKNAFEKPKKKSGFDFDD